MPGLPIVVIDAELEIHAVEERVVVGVRPHEQFPHLEAVDRPAAPLGVRTLHRQIKPLLKPVGDAVGPFDGAVDRVVGNDAAGEIGSLPPDRREIGVHHEIEHTLIRNLGIVDLDLVGLREHRGRSPQAGRRPRQRGYRNTCSLTEIAFFLSGTSLKLGSQIITDN